LWPVGPRGPSLPFPIFAHGCRSPPYRVARRATRCRASTSSSACVPNRALLLRTRAHCSSARREAGLPWCGKSSNNHGSRVTLPRFLRIAMNVLRFLVTTAPAADAAFEWALFDSAGKRVDHGRGAPTTWPPSDRLEAVVAAAQVRLLVLQLP